jgi:predicted kinase
MPNGRLPMLIVFAGLPGAGKSAIAAELAGRLGAVYVRIDTIEQAIRNSPGVAQPINEEGYRVAYALAVDNLKLGTSVVSDGVNAIQESREAWRGVARLANADLLEVEVLCSDRAVHQERVESRTTNIPGLRLPTWAQVLAREYEPWDRDHLVIDTAHTPILACVENVIAAIDAQRARSSSALFSRASG